MTVRISRRTVPSGSLALIAIALAPSRSVTGTVSRKEFCGVRSRCWWTSTPLRVTLTIATPLLEVTSAAATLLSWVNLRSILGIAEGDLERKEALVVDGAHLLVDR